MLYQKTFKDFLFETKEIQKLANLLNVRVTDINQFSEKELAVILGNIGDHDFVPDNSFNQKELQLGIKTELEHTRSIIVAKLIAKDHLSEDPMYYTKLKKVGL